MRQASCSPGPRAGWGTFTGDVWNCLGGGGGRRIKDLVKCWGQVVHDKLSVNMSVSLILSLPVLIEPSSVRQTQRTHSHMTETVVIL
jgi:hypothetical protein